MKLHAAIDELLAGAGYHAHDARVVGALLLAAAVIFGYFRPYPLPDASSVLLAATGVAIVVGLWIRRFPGPSLHRESLHLDWGDAAAIILVLVISAGIYYPLCRMHFDTGTDLSVAFGVDAVWFGPWAGINRPLVGIGPYVAMLITPGSIDGFFVVVVASRFATATLIYLFLRVMAPAHRAVALAAGILFVLNPAELSRFNLWSIYYQVALFSFAASFLLFVWSYRAGSRALLVLSCVVLGVSFLQYEHGFPLSVVLPMSLLLIPKRRHLAVWFIAWYGTVAVFACRLATYLLFEPAPYQRVLFNLWGKWPETAGQWAEMLVRNVVLQMGPALRMVEGLSVIPRYPLESSIVLAGIASFTWWLLKSTSDSNRLRPSWSLAAMGAVGALLGVALYIPLPVTSMVPDYADHPDLRYQYFAGVGQAIFWAALVAIIAGFAATRAQRNAVTAIVVGVVSAGALAESLRYQSSGGVLNPYYRYEVASRVLAGLDARLPELRQGDAIFLELSDGDRSPLGWGYTALHWSCRLFGVPLAQGRLDAGGGIQTRVFGYPAALHQAGPKCARTHRFRATEGGEVSFVETILSGDAELNCPPCGLNRFKRVPGAPLPFVELPSARWGATSP